MENCGLIHVYTGAGKGKSTAAFGLCLRASGWGLRSAIVQFMKSGQDCGEILACSALPLIDFYCYGSERFLSKGDNPCAEDQELARQALSKARELLADSAVDLLVLDELGNAIYFGLVSEEEALALLRHKRPEQELVLTGRNMPQALIELADLVTEMTEIKHQYQKGRKARKGIEY
ncbi:MAG: cob(I)yrinic acid a,c-diamide adenosyltransferase [Clostridia bacterium]|nr:cob(I)yrinic acid a,c-diamide adenosyltransferase [Clostridia bacterium]